MSKGRNIINQNAEATRALQSGIYTHEMADTASGANISASFPRGGF